MKQYLLFISNTCGTLAFCNNGVPGNMGVAMNVSHRVDNLRMRVDIARIVSQCVVGLRATLVSRADTTAPGHQ